MLKDSEDAYGHEIFDYFSFKRGYEIIEREDGYFYPSTDSSKYFLMYNQWPRLHKEAMNNVNGRVLDIGCGAGKFSLYLLEKGHAVVSTDPSPIAVKVCKLIGLKNIHTLEIDEIDQKLGTFDTILLLGDNFGYVENSNNIKKYFKTFYSMTSETGRLIIESKDPYKTSEPEHLEYQETNRKKNRMPGQERICRHYKKYTSPWYDHLLLASKELEKLLENTSWQINTTITDENESYICILDKKTVK